ncbi:FAD dependent oxidoreductase [Dentipellis sp. KUC8613]|nr:FAD dependent oxidoreductase [Dentipellis sp. KUC8613]
MSRTLRALTAGLNSTGRFKYKSPESAIDYVVVGGGVVGLAIARRLTQAFPEKTTFLLERHERAGEEISSRNSEVIHAGLYYPLESLKTKLCIRGRQLLYDYCGQNTIPFLKTGKLVVARADQRPYIENLHAKARTLPPAVLPTELISGDRARELEPDLSRDIAAALWSPETGIVDSHAYMESLEKEIMDSENGELAYSTRVVRIDPHAEGSEDGWVVQAVTGDAGEGDAMLARVLINAAGLSAPLVLNSLLGKDALPMYFARGSYASYRGPGIGGVKHLIYPCPDTAKSKDSHAFQSLGTHLTLDLQGKVRFGPDLEWIEPPANEEAEADFWTRHLVPDESRLKLMHEAVTSYLPAVKFEGLQPDYVGIRPKLVPPGGGFQDFELRVDHTGDFVQSRNGKGNSMISLLGIESPGLTASLALAERVVDGLLVGTNEYVK